MKASKFLIVLIFFYSINLLATPREVEVWFLTMESENKNALIYPLMDKMQMSRHYALRDCIPMGDGCFHPQEGYMEDEKNKTTQVKEEVKSVEVKTINAVDVDMIKCDQNNHFDIFCGKAQANPTKENTDLEIWFDTSASLKQYDYAQNGSCRRKMFAQKVQDACGNGKVIFSVFNTSIKEAGSLDVLCDTYGMNDTDRMIEWIKNSSAKRLIIITDIDEYKLKFGDYLNSIGAVIKGDKPDGFTPKALEAMSDSVISYCKK